MTSILETELQGDNAVIRQAGTVCLRLKTGKHRLREQKRRHCGTRNREKAADTKAFKKMTHILSLTTLAVCAILSGYLYRIGAFSSTETLQAAVAQSGAAGALLFFLVQVVQVVIPIIPGGISLLAGVILFGPWKGFLLNYTGICLGSCIAFAISRSIGKDLLRRMFSAERITKYENWTEKQNRFTKLFTIAIFFPVAPDDFLCYLAGTTRMRWWVFVLIILLGKPASIAIYSIGLEFLSQQLLALFM